MEKLNENSCIVRLETTYWKNNRKVCVQKSLVIMKRKSSGNWLLIEDAYNIGPKEVMQKVVNLYDCSDGVYQLIPHSKQYYKLVPYKETK